jgi:hypothetical protein
MRYLISVVVLALVITLTASQVAAQTTFTVTGVGLSSYNIDGQSNPTLTVVRGQTYSFTCDNCTGHPFRVQSTQGFGGTLYSNLISGPNPGTSFWTLTVPIEETATNTLYYQCAFHSPMNGVINVVAPPPTPIPTDTPMPTDTPRPTPTPTPTPTPIPCVGDCNQDNSVTVDELLTMVNIALGNTSVSICSQSDTNRDRQITVDEILAAVNNALSGCQAI